MKIIRFASILMVCFVGSCGQKSTEKSFSNKHRIVLNAFTDHLNATSFNSKELTELPTSVNLINSMTAVKDQGDRGTCTFFTAMAIVEAAIKKIFNTDVNLSEEYLNFKVKHEDDSGEDGSNVIDNLAAVKKYGLLLEDDWGYQPSWFSKGLACEKYDIDNDQIPSLCISHNAPPAQIMKQVMSGEAFQVITIRNINKAIAYLANEKLPLTLGVTVNENGWPDSGDVFYNDRLRLECLKVPDDCGAHSITLTGYDLTKKVFFFKNSWGDKWGHNGYGTITFDSVDRFSTNEFTSVKLNGKFALKTALNHPNIILNNFNVQSTIQKNNKISIQTSGDLQGVSGQFIYLSTILVKKSESINQDPDDQNTQTIYLSDANAIKFNNPLIKASISISPESHLDKLNWGYDNKNLQLNISSAMMNTPEALEAMNSQEDRLFLKTTIFSFSDSGLRIVKRIYHTPNEMN